MKMPQIHQVPLKRGTIPEFTWISGICFGIFSEFIDKITIQEIKEIINKRIIRPQSYIAEICLIETEKRLNITIPVKEKYWLTDILIELAYEYEHIYNKPNEGED